MTPLPQNESQPQAILDSTRAAENSQESMGMSSFVNFDAAGAEEEDLKTILPKPTLPPSGAARKAMIDEVSLGTFLLTCVC